MDAAVFSWQLGVFTTYAKKQNLRELVDFLAGDWFAQQYFSIIPGANGEGLSLSGRAFALHVLGFESRKLLLLRVCSIMGVRA